MKLAIFMVINCDITPNKTLDTECPKIWQIWGYARWLKAVIFHPILFLAFVTRLMTKIFCHKQIEDFHKCHLHTQRRNLPTFTNLDFPSYNKNASSANSILAREFCYQADFSSRLLCHWIQKWVEKKVYFSICFGKCQPKSRDFE